ncbi:MAG: hypothetical protein HY549_02820 [Elusimicrobia bacterium]|nr:hypothetical protein [Elusimicrobiota bacterium]
MQLPRRDPADVQAEDPLPDGSLYYDDSNARLMLRQSAQWVELGGGGGSIVLPATGAQPCLRRAAPSGPPATCPVIPNGVWITITISSLAGTGARIAIISARCDAYQGTARRIFFKPTGSPAYAPSMWGEAISGCSARSLVANPDGSTQHELNTVMVPLNENMQFDAHFFGNAAGAIYLVGYARQGSDPPQTP